MIFHFVTWYPSKTNHAEGIFIQRQIELLAADQQFKHVVIRKSKGITGWWLHIKALLGFFETEKAGNVLVISIPDESSLYRFYFWRFRKKIEQFILRRLFNKYQPCMAHLHVVYGFAEEVLYLNERKALPFIVSEHMGPFPFQWITATQELIIQPMRASSKVAAVSSAQARQIESFTGVTPVVIPNVINEREFYYAAAPLHTPTDKQLNIVFTGVYTKAKGGDYLLHVLPQFLKTYPHTLLHMVGFATEQRMEELNVIIRQHQIAKNIKFHGNLSPAQLNTLYQQCDFYVCSSEWESFGLSVLEGLFTGLPALCTDCGGVKDFIDADNGILIPNDQHPETLLKGMLQMAEVYHRFNRRQIAEQVARKFAGSSIQKQYFSIYRDIINSTAA